MDHHGYESVFDVFTTYYRDPKSNQDDSGCVDEHNEH